MCQQASNLSSGWSSERWKSISRGVCPIPYGPYALLPELLLLFVLPLHVVYVAIRTDRCLRKDKNRAHRLQWTTATSSKNEASSLQPALNKAPLNSTCILFTLHRECSLSQTSISQLKPTLSILPNKICITDHHSLSPAQGFARVALIHMCKKIRQTTFLLNLVRVGPHTQTRSFPELTTPQKQFNHFHIITYKIYPGTIRTFIVQRHRGAPHREGSTTVPQLAWSPVHSTHASVLQHLHSCINIHPLFRLFAGVQANHIKLDNAVKPVEEGA